jgi:hypothetical protein
MRCDAHPLSLMMFCPGDPRYAVTAESSSGPATSKMYLCLSLLTIGRPEDCAPGTENPIPADHTNTKSELVVFGMSRRANTFVSEWVRFSLFEHSFQVLIICTTDVNNTKIKGNVRDANVHPAPPRIPTCQRDRCRQPECSGASDSKTESLGQTSVW